MKAKRRALVNPQKSIGLSVRRVLNNVCPRPTLVDAVKHLNMGTVQEQVVMGAETVRISAVACQNGGHAVLSYRAFHVGAGGVGLIPFNGRGTYRWFTYAAWNTKPAKRAEKYCAEMRILRAARQEGCTHMLLIVVSGWPREEDKTLTLHPCEACRAIMRGKYAGFFQPESQIITLQPNSQIREFFTLHALMKAHDEC